MKEGKEISPPKWAERFMTWYCRPELLEDLQGDLNEYFERNVRSKGVQRAKLIYAIDVLKFLRIYTIRKPEFINLLIQWIMIGSYIKTSGRSIIRNKLFSTINIAGLAISMSVGLLLIGLLSDMFSYDEYNKNSTRIYRVISQYGYLERQNSSFNASSSLRLEKAIKESIPGVEEIAVFKNGFDGDVIHSEKIIPLKGLWANDAVLRTFTFPMIYGDASTALTNPFSVVLSETSSKKLFGESDPVGKTITVNEKEYAVTGVINDVPQFSHVHFDMLASLSTREILFKDDQYELSWDNMWSNYTYLLLLENTNPETLQSNLDLLSIKEDKSVNGVHIKLALQPLKEIALGEDLNNSIGPTMDKNIVWIIAFLSIVVILSACFNYTNLSIARSIKRSREVGVRKVIGALKRHVLAQFITEAVIISLLAVIIGIGLFILIRPHFLTMSGALQEMLRLELSPKLIGYFIVLAVITGTIAGFFPAFFFSKVNAIQALKNLNHLPLFKGMTLRKALIVVQYTISLLFITATAIGFKQYQNLLSFNLGYQTENIININMQGNKPHLLIKELEEIPEISEISKSQLVTSVGSYWSMNVKYTDPNDSSDIYFNTVDEHYLPLHGHRFLAGRNFATKGEVIVNEKFLKRYNIGNGQAMKALGEWVTVEREKMQIVGVLKDFHYGKVTNKIPEVILIYSPNVANIINVKIHSTDLMATMNKIGQAWHKTDNVHTLQARFYDDAIEHAYSEISMMLKIIGTLSFLAICIASMGLFGMVVFTTETRLKEISIRKVLGANEGSLIYLLSKGFLLLLALSALIALPLIYLFFDQVVLTTFAYHQPIGWMELFIGTGAIGLLALIMICSQTWRAARSNPAQVLKTE